MDVQSEPLVVTVNANTFTLAGPANATVGQPFTLTATLKDPAGTPYEGTEITLLRATDGQVMGSATTGSDGTATFTLKRRHTALSDTSRKPHLGAEYLRTSNDVLVTIGLSPQPPAPTANSLTLAVSASEATSGQTLDLTATLVNATGTPLPGVAVTFVRVAGNGGLCIRLLLAFQRPPMTAGSRRQLTSRGCQARSTSALRRTSTTPS